MPAGESESTSDVDSAERRAAEAVSAFLDARDADPDASPNRFAPSDPPAAEAFWQAVEGLGALCGGPVPADAVGGADRTQSHQVPVTPDGAAVGGLAGCGEVGRRIGRYRTLERLGEGGFGVVYLAEQQEPVRRRVALKVIKPGMDSQAVIGRFEAERQALALMDHPNIAKVFDAGTTEQGRPYFVMEHVAGVPITEHCDRHKLSVERRLELFTHVCEAVQHAHQKAVIHRDLKPQNIPVSIRDGKALNQRLTEQTIFTEQGQLIGTPEYMSPEQAEMTAQDIDTRSDIYSLGVLLYELLTGSLPFERQSLRRAGLAEIQRIIREEEPPKPSTRLSTLVEEPPGREEPPTSVGAVVRGERVSELRAAARAEARGSAGSSLLEIARNRHVDPRTLRRKLRGDLDWITMKALEKDRTRRYASASDLASDIRRHLGHEPVTAGPPSAGYRVKKLVRRNRGLVTGATVVLIVLLAGIAASTWQAVRATRAERLAEERLREAEEERAEARRQAAVARAVTDFLNDDLLAQADPYVEPDHDIKLRVVLDRAAERIEGRFDNQPLVEAAIRNTLGVTFHGLGDYPSAELHLERAADLRRQVLGEEHPDTLTSLNNLALLYYNQRRYDQAEPLWGRTLELRRRVLGPAHPKTLNTMRSLASLYQVQGRFDQAEPLYVEALDVERRVRGEEHLHTLIAMSNLAKLYCDHGRYDQAEALYSEAVDLLKRVMPPDYFGTGITLGGYGECLTRTGRYGEAESALLEAHQILAAARGAERKRTATVIRLLAALYDAWGKPDKAAEWRAKLPTTQPATQPATSTKPEPEDRSTP